MKMKMKIINWTVLLVGLVLLFCVYNIQAVEKHVKKEFKERKTFSFKVERITEVADLLAKIYQVPVCVEEARWFFRDGLDNADTKKMLEERQKKGFTIQAKKNTLKEILEKFVIEHPEYQYKFDKKNIVFNLFPKTNAITDKNIDINFVNSNLKQMMMRQDTLGLKDLGIDASPKAFPGNIGWMEKDLKINAKEMLLCEVLNNITSQLPQSRSWIITEIEKHLWSAFWDGTGRIPKYRLSFKIFEPFDPSVDSNSVDHKKLMHIERQRWEKKLQKKVGLINEDSTK